MMFPLYPEGNITVDYNNYKDTRMNFYIPRLHDKEDEDTSLFEEDKS